MRGFPKFLNSKQDYLNCISAFPEETKKELQILLDTRFSWFDVAIIEDEGLMDNTHRVIADDEGVKTQQILREDSNARIFMLDFAVEEVEELINA